MKLLLSLVTTLTHIAKPTPRLITRPGQFPRLPLGKTGTIKDRIK